MLINLLLGCLLLATRSLRKKYAASFFFFFFLFYVFKSRILERLAYKNSLFFVDDWTKSTGTQQATASAAE